MTLKEDHRGSRGEEAASTALHFSHCLHTSHFNTKNVGCLFVVVVCQHIFLLLCRQHDPTTRAGIVIANTFLDNHAECTDASDTNLLSCCVINTCRVEQRRANSERGA